MNKNYKDLSNQHSITHKYDFRYQQDAKGWLYNPLFHPLLVRVLPPCYLENDYKSELLKIHKKVNQMYPNTDYVRAFRDHFHECKLLAEN